MDMFVVGLIYSLMGLSVAIVYSLYPKIGGHYFIYILCFGTGYLFFGHALEGLIIVLLCFSFNLFLKKLAPFWKEDATALMAFAIISFVFYIFTVKPIWIAINTLSLLLFSLELFHILNVGSRKEWHRKKEPFVGTISRYPKVSIHVPIYKEPIDVVKKTLLSLSRLDYPDYEACVIVNNTQEEEEHWRPISHVCDELGKRFRFFHLHSLPGYKAGALNFALKVTDEQAEIISIVDSDYIVEPNFLKATVPYFEDEEIAIVQTPQDYREVPRNPQMSGIYHAYRYFFSIIMNSCNEHNAASFMGTMGLVRKRCLEEIGGWDEKIITEDSELGIRVHAKGYKSIYIDKSFGRGLMPFSFYAYKKQRFRWSFGNMQTIMKNLRRLFLGKLTLEQKICYLGSNTVWFNNLFVPCFILFFSIFLDKNSAFEIAYSLVGVYTGFILIHVMGFMVVFPRMYGVSRKEGLWAFISFLALTWPMGIAWLTYIFKSEGVFRRTPKVKKDLGFLELLKEAKAETALVVISFIFVIIGLLRGLILPALLLIINGLIFCTALWILKAFREKTPGKADSLA